MKPTFTTSMSPNRPGFRPIRQKLNRILMATTFLALLIAGVALAAFNLRSQLQAFEEALATQADIIGLASTSALMFDDKKVAGENLSVMRVQPDLAVAALFDPQGKLFAAFRSAQSGDEATPQKTQAAAVQVDREWVRVWRPIVSNKELLGTIYLQARHNLLRRVLEYMGVLCAILGGSMAVALLLSNRLQSSLVAPLLAISGVAQRIMLQQDLSLRAPTTSHDEIGTLGELFNAMLDELERRAEVLEQANRALRSSDERYQLAVRGSSAGLWDWDMVTGTMFYSPRFKALLGYSHEEFPDVAGSLAGIIHEDDREAVKETLREHLSQDKAYQVECRLRLKSGEWRWFLIAGMAQKNGMGEAFRMAGSVIEITERKAAEQVLQEANRAKDEFLATLAHELRNPLAPIRTSLQILKKDDANGVLSQRARDIMERQLAHMVRLIDDLLDISRINSGKIGIERSRISLAATLETAVDISRPLIEARGHTLSLALPTRDIELMADATRLAQAIGNLLNNAAKYTPEHGRIQLRAWQEAATAVIEVTDNGMGIPQHMLEAVFSLFTQVGRTMDRAQGGLGIGLYLVRSLVELHGGNVTAASAGANLGCTLTVRVPCLLPEMPVAPADRPPAGTSSAAGRLRVLVVDDNIDAAETLMAVLEMDGHLGRMVHEGQLVLAAAQDFAPDVVLLDIGLPGMNGYEVARQLRADPRFSRTVLVAVTGWGSENDRRLAFEAGFDKHLTKPVDIELLLSLLGQLPAGAVPVS